MACSLLGMACWSCFVPGDGVLGPGVHVDGRPVAGGVVRPALPRRECFSAQPNCWTSDRTPFLGLVFDPVLRRCCGAAGCVMRWCSGRRGLRFSGVFSGVQPGDAALRRDGEMRRCGDASGDYILILLFHFAAINIYLLCAFERWLRSLFSPPTTHVGVCLKLRGHSSSKHRIAGKPPAFRYYANYYTYFTALIIARLCIAFCARSLVPFLLRGPKGAHGL